MTETETKLKTTIAAIRAVRDLTGWDLRTSKSNVDAIVSMANVGTDLGVLNGAFFDTPRGGVPYEDVIDAVIRNARKES